MNTLPRMTILAIAALGLGSCSADSTDEQPAAIDQVEASQVNPETEAFLDEHGLAGLDTRGIIDKLDAQLVDERPTDLYASIRPNDLLLRDAESEVVLPMPAEEVYVSIAPYVTHTHECYYHSLTTCLGEQRGTNVTVSLVDDSGKTVVDEEITAFDNGFVGLWLPRGIDGTLTMSVDDVSGSIPLTTSGEDYATCLTTLVMQ